MSVGVPFRNFSHGELDPKMLARSDVAAYQDGAKTITNGFVSIYGGVAKRPGLHTLAWGADLIGRLIPYIFSQDQAYFCLFSNQRIHVYAAGTDGPELASIASPYTAFLNSDGTLGGTVTTLRYVQGLDTMILVDGTGAIAPQALRRGASDTDWSLNAINFDPEPLAEGVFRPNSAIVISSDGGTGYTATVQDTSAFAFLSGDNGRTIDADGITWKIVGVPDGGATASLEYDGVAPSGLPLTINALDWTLQGSPQTYLSMSAPNPDDKDTDDLPMVGTSVHLLSSGANWKTSSTIGLDQMAEISLICNISGSHSDSDTIIDSWTLSGLVTLDGAWGQGTEITLYSSNSKGVENIVCGASGVATVGYQNAVMTVTSCVQAYGNVYSFSGTIPGSSDLKPRNGDAGWITFSKLNGTGNSQGWSVADGDWDDTAHTGRMTDMSERYSYYDAMPIGIRSDSSTPVDTNEAFRSTDVGAWVTYNNGQFKITGFNSASDVSAEVMTSPTSSVLAEPASWSILYPEWSSTGQYPKAVTMHQQRLVFGRDAELWCSVLGEYYSFQPGTDDDDAIDFTVDSEQANPIVHLADQRNILVFTSGTEYVVTSNGNAFTAKNAMIETQTHYGSSNQRPVIIDSECVFVERGGKKLRRYGYDYSSDSYHAPELTVMAEHITGEGVIDCAFKKEPDPLLFCVRKNGQAAVCTTDIEQNVIAWSRMTTNEHDRFLSVACAPAGDHNEAWFLTYRNGYGCVEKLDDSYYTDGAAVAYNVSSLSTPAYMTGNVDVLGDGKYLGRFAAGNIQLPAQYSRVEYGAPIPFELTTLPVSLQTQAGDTSNARSHIVTVMLQVMNTQLLNINGYERTFDKYGTADYGTAPSEYTGRLIAQDNTGWSPVGLSRVSITADKPLSVNVLGIYNQMNINTR